MRSLFEGITWTCWLVAAGLCCIIFSGYTPASPGRDAVVRSTHQLSRSELTGIIRGYPRATQQDVIIEVPRHPAGSNHIGLERLATSMLVPVSAPNSPLLLCMAAENWIHMAEQFSVRKHSPSPLPAPLDLKRVSRKLDAGLTLDLPDERALVRSLAERELIRTISRREHQAFRDALDNSVVHLREASSAGRDGLIAVRLTGGALSWPIESRPQFPSLRARNSTPCPLRLECAGLRDSIRLIAYRGNLPIKIDQRIGGTDWVLISNERCSAMELLEGLAKVFGLVIRPDGNELLIEYQASRECFRLRRRLRVQTSCYASARVAEFLSTVSDRSRARMQSKEGLSFRELTARSIDIIHDAIQAKLCAEIVADGLWMQEPDFGMGSIYIAAEGQRVPVLLDAGRRITLRELCL